MPSPRELVVPPGDQEVDSELGTADEATRGYECDRCGKAFDGEPAGSGLFLWSRGEEVRYEEPPLCQRCADQVSLNALLLSEFEEEEEG